ncbi:O-antigen ligase family protein [Rubinisphaera margarita]|uniref:O-antigen ligase family protein n=1 Tax=Rubinisphaera margarita TaxID=2909586 RepID=UPI001EE953FE|nr:O-antigen ligase family protein [Rubinisphaera margarita]MCG6154448.1 O-antigen ligase family protein [Rubinisphaera margarita]
MAFNPTYSSRSRRRSSSHSGRRQGSSGRSTGTVDYVEPQSPLLKLADVSLYAGLLAVVLVFGGRTPIGSLVLVVATGITALLWCGHRMLTRSAPWIWSGFELLLVCAVALGLFQLMPMSPEMLETASPAISTFLTPDAELGAEIDSPLTTWDRISLAPSETRLTLAPIACVLVLFLLLIQRFRDRQHGKKVVLAVGFGTAVFAVFGSAQYLLSNGKFFWVFEHPYTNTAAVAKGSFTNSNHFAGFLALSLGPLLAWAISRSGERRSSRDRMDNGPTARLIVGALATFALLVGIVLTGSRGGLLLAATALGVSLPLIIFRGLADGRTPIAIAVAGVLALGGMSVVGEKILERNAQELVTSNLTDLDTGDARSFVWNANLAAQQEFRWFGTGLGTHKHVIPAYHASELPEHVYTHAENSYLQIGTETGVVGWLLAGCGILLVIHRLLTRIVGARRSPAEIAMMTGVGASFCVFLVQGVYDFAWYAPAYMLVLGIYLAYVFAAPRQVEATPVPLQWRGLSAGVCGLCALAIVGAGGLAIWPAAQAEPYTVDYMRYTNRAKQFDDVKDELHLLKIRLGLLKNALRYHPEDIDNNIRIATNLRRVFELQDAAGQFPMPIPQIRAAAYAGGFESTEQLQAWLQNPAILQRGFPLMKACLHFAGRAARECPVRSQPLLILSEFCFIENPDSALSEYYITRSERAEPHSSEIAFSRGFTAWNQGEVDKAIDYWKPIFSANEKSQKRIIALLSPAIKTADFDTLFEPDLAALTAIVRAYKDKESDHFPDAAIYLAEKTVSTLPELTLEEQKTSISATFSYLNAAGVVNTTTRLIEITTPYVESDLELRSAFARWLAKHGEYTAATGHLEYCLSRTPGDPKLQDLMKTCRQSQQSFRATGFSSGGIRMLR